MGDIETFQIFHPKYDALVEKLRPLGDAVHQLIKIGGNQKMDIQYGAFITSP